jgi:hypothetical protein
MTTTTWAIYQRFEGQPTRVLYSHLTEQQADDETERLNDHCRQQGLRAGTWTEQHHPDCAFVIG